MQEKVLDRREREKAKLDVLFCDPLGLKGRRGRVQKTSGQWYDVHAVIFQTGNMPVGTGQGDHYWRCRKGGGAVAVAGPENDAIRVFDWDHAHYGRSGTVVRTTATAPQGGA